MLTVNFNASEVENRTVATVSSVMQTRGLDTSLITAEAKLADTLGLKSMDLAEIVLTLEDEFDVDPFGEIPITSVRTVGDLVTAYLVGLGLAEWEPAETVVPAVVEPRARRSGRRR